VPAPRGAAAAAWALVYKHAGLSDRRHDSIAFAEGFEAAVVDSFAAAGWPVPGIVIRESQLNSA